MEPLRWAVSIAAWAPSEAQLALLLSALPADDAQRVRRFQQPADRKRALVSQLLQRAAVARALGEPWAGVALRRTKGGKPFYAGPRSRPDAPNLNFNVSHEGDFVILACESHCLCGADVAAPQQLRAGSGRPLLEVLALMREQLVHAEWLALQALAGDEPAMEATFQAIWSCKEAFIKARGDGVAFDMARLEVQLPHSAASQEWAARPVQAARLLVDGQPQPRWRAFLQQLPSRHWAAVVRGPPDAAVDALGLFRATFRQPQLPDEQLQRLLDAPSPCFELLPVEDLLPDDLLARYERLGGELEPRAAAPGGGAAAGP